MGTLIDEEQFIEDNAKNIGAKMDSPLNKYTDKKTMFVTYYHVNPDYSTVNDGFENVERIIGKNSPIRYNKIENVPLLLDSDSINLSLSDEDQGLDMDYEGSGTLLPNVIEPYDNDMFLITHMDKRILFMVSSFELDTVKAHNFYKIDFILKSIDDWDDIEDQVVATYNCIYSNIGTENKCIVRSDILDMLKRLDSVYFSIADAYYRYFYNEKFNQFIASPNNAYSEYDPCLNKFITDNKLLTRKNDLKVIYTTNEDEDPEFEQRFERSIYNALLKKNLKWFTKNYYSLDCGGLANSIFAYFNIRNIASVRLREDDDPTCVQYLDSRIVKSMRCKDDREIEAVFTPVHGDEVVIEPADEDTSLVNNKYLGKLLYRFFNDKKFELSTMDIDALENADFDFIDKKDLQTYRLIPIILYILKYINRKELNVKENTGSILN